MNSLNQFMKIMKYSFVVGLISVVLGFVSDKFGHKGDHRNVMADIPDILYAIAFISAVALAITFLFIFMH